MSIKITENHPWLLEKLEDNDEVGIITDGGEYVVKLEDDVESTK